jgi:hypothetical protein
MKKIILLLLLLSMGFSANVTHMYFNNANEMVSKINTLDAKEYASLKIWVQNSTNNSFGRLGSPYNIVYIASK